MGTRWKWIKIAWKVRKNWPALRLALNVVFSRDQKMINKLTHNLEYLGTIANR